MSYDVCLTMFTGEGDAEVADAGNYTSNCAPMWRTALGYSLRDLHGKLAAACVPELERAVAHMRAPENAEAYRAMNPPNQWGDHATATDFLAGILECCRRHPVATVKVSA